LDEHVPRARQRRRPGADRRHRAAQIGARDARRVTSARRARRELSSGDPGRLPSDTARRAAPIHEESPVTQTTSKQTTDRPDFKVADLSLAEFGRKEIELAEHEMPGLMAMRERHESAQPLAGARITG